MLKALIRKQLTEIFKGAFVNKKTGKAKPRSKTIKSMILTVLLFGLISLSLCSITVPLAIEIDLKAYGWVYFSIMGLLSIALGVFGSVFNTYSSLYLPKDNELLGAMPISPVKILVSRSVGVYILSLAFTLIAWFPTMLAYWISEGITLRNIIMPFLMLFVLSLFSFVLTAVLGWIVALIATKVKGKSLVIVLMSILILTVYYIGYFKMSSYIRSIIANVATIGNTFREKALFVWILGTAVLDSIPHFLLFTLITVALAALCFFLMSISYEKITKSVSVGAKGKVKKNGYRRSSLDKSLLKRELGHFLSSPNWILNDGFGIIILTVGGVAAIIYRGAVARFIETTVNNLPIIGAAIPVLIFSAVALVLSANIISAPSISLEGKNLWIIQSSPIDIYRVIHAKEKLHVMLNVYPTLFVTVVIGVISGIKIYEIVLVFCAEWLYIWFIARIGLVFNLIWPNLTWTNEIVPVKQSMYMLIILFGGWFASLIIGAVGVFFSKIVSPALILAAVIIILGVSCLLLGKWLKTKGTETLKNL